MLFGMEKVVAIINPNEEILNLQERSVEEISELLPHSRVELVGAMAVPMVGRPEIDILVISEDVHKDSEILAQHEYKQGSFVDEASFLKRKENGVEIAVQIMSLDNEMIETHRGIISTLRKNDDLRKKYEDFKQSLDGLTIEEYKRKKSTWLKENISPLLKG
ncbi:MAG: hypothetical protein A2928_03055 [Candidatus Taylorbacteria bacterium RIFCSPLOWO2_01_FULL_45_15b]|uniref:GrpB family protein n=1 Tax=Candidatus Taylorbacteria bacterium RIFCSPLOWO2_01_FULL_45_15b TaxID=1802319 RepID=A0A1G2NAI9_9BACT|nr:MAG: hypothetical protein A2928_03055 [Candidatus Taylorbacteria bacterium RIFCSPLOWO2_01_FULL_45_15b]